MRHLYQAPFTIFADDGPLSTLYHFIHPEWLGVDFWLEREKMELFEQLAREFADKVNVFLMEKHGERPVKLWLTMNEPNAMAMLTCLVMAFPHEKKGIHSACRAWGNLINAHCRAYDAIHDLYRDRGWERPMVTFNTMQQAIYLLGKVTTDILNCRRNGVERADLESYLEDGRAKFDEEVAKCPAVGGRTSSRAPLSPAMGIEVVLQPKDVRAAAALRKPYPLPAGLPASPRRTPSLHT